MRVARPLSLSVAGALVAALLTPVTAGAGTAASAAVVRSRAVTHADATLARVRVRDGVARLRGQRAWPLGLQGDATPAAARRAAVAALVRLGLPLPVAAAAADEDASSGGSASFDAFEFVQPAGDLDRDGKRDVLSERFVFSEDGESLTLVARRGVNGAKLWSRDMGDGFGFAMPARVGEDGAAGVLLLTFDGSGEDAFVAGVWRQTLTVTALRGTDGAPLWTRSFDGVIADSVGGFAVTGLAINVAPLDAVGNRATDVLVSTLDIAAVAGQGVGQGTVEVLDGGDGSTVATAEEGGMNTLPIATPAGDLDANGGDDLIFFTEREDDEPGPSGTVVGIASSDGSELWRTDDLAVDAFAFVDDPGDMDGDGHDEVLSSSFFGRSFVLDGATGVRRWSRRGQIAYPLGDATGDRLPEVALTTIVDPFFFGEFGFATEGGAGLPLPLPLATAGLGGGSVAASSGGGGGSVSAGGGRGGPRIGVVTKVIDVTGDVVRRDRTTVPFPSGNSVTFVEFGIAGDLDGDRRRDSLASVVVADIDAERFSSKRRFLSGRTGRRLWSPEGGDQPVGAAVDGDGDDVVRLDPSGPGLRVAALRGDDGSRLWGRRLRTRGSGGGFAQAADLTGDGRAEVILLTDNGVTRVLGARRGATRWSTGGGPPAAQPTPTEPE